jgi:ABC-type transporter Mla MlaB component
MLRISVINEPDSTRLKLEGKLAHDWVAELRNAWEFTCTLAPAQSQTVDLAAVSFVDEAGRQLLSDMHVAGVELVGSGPMMTALIEEIACPPDPKKWLRKGFLVLLFLAACLGAPKLLSQESKSAEVMSLEQAIAIAKKSNSQIMTEQLEALKATDEVAMAKTKRLPSINADIYGSSLLAPSPRPAGSYFCLLQGGHGEYDFRSSNPGLPAWGLAESRSACLRPELQRKASSA